MAKNKGNRTRGNESDAHHEEWATEAQVRDPRYYVPVVLRSDGDVPEPFRGQRGTRIGRGRNLVVAFERRVLGRRTWSLAGPERVLTPAMLTYPGRSAGHAQRERAGGAEEYAEALAAFRAEQGEGS